MDKDNVIAITETYRLYKLLDDYCQSKVPSEFVQYLEENKDMRVGKQITAALPTAMQGLSRESYNLILYMYRFIVGEEYFNRALNNETTKDEEGTL